MPAELWFSQLHHCRLWQCLDVPAGSPVPAPTSWVLPKLIRRLPGYECRDNLDSFSSTNCSWLRILLFGCTHSQMGFIFQTPDPVPKETTHKSCHLRAAPITAGSAIKVSQQQLIRSQMKPTVTNPTKIALAGFWSQTGREQIHQQTHLPANNFL